MACEYWYNGDFRTEEEFKSILENGLLDQLLDNKTISLKEFELDTSKIKNKLKESITKEPVQVRVLKKIQRNLNTVRNENDDPIDANPAVLLREAEKVRGDNNKKLRLIVKTTDYASTGVGQGKTISSVIHTGLKGKEAKALQQELKNSRVNFGETLKDGYVYMLIPSAYGLYPVKLFTNLVKDTTDFDTVKEKLKELRKEKSEEKPDPDTIKKIGETLQDILYRFNIDYFTKDDEVSQYQSTRGNSTSVSGTVSKNTFTLSWSEIFDEKPHVRNFTKADLTLEAAVEFLGGRIRKVDFANINSKGYNEALAESGAITTDLMHEDGNFFNSSSFFLDTYQLSPEDRKNFKKQVLTIDDSEDSVTYEDAEFGESSKQPEIPNEQENNTKKEEDPVFNEEIPEKGFDPDSLSYEALMGSALASQAAARGSSTVPSTSTKKEETEKAEEPDEDFKDDMSPEELAIAQAAIEGANREAAESLATEIEEGGVSKGMALLEQEAAAKRAEQERLLDSEQESGDDIDTDSDSFNDSEDSFGDPNLRTKMGPKAELPTKEEAKENRKKGWETLKRMLGEKAVRQSGKKGTVRYIRNFESLKNYLPKESYEMLEEALKHGDELYGLFTTAAVLIQELAPAGTEAHEAFHVIFNLVLPLEQRFKILNEIFEKYKEEIPLKRKEVTLKDGTKKIQYIRPTFIELEEFLADKFMNYEQSQEVDKLKPLSKQPLEKDKRTAAQKKKDIYRELPIPFTNTNAFFKGLSRMLKVFFKKNKALNIDNLFENINLGVYADSINFKNTVLKRSIRQSVGQSVRETAPNRKYANPIEKRWAFRYFNSKIKKTIKGFREQIDPEGKLSVPEIINKVKRKGDPKNNILPASGPHVVFSNAITEVVKDIALLKNLKKRAEAREQSAAVAKYTALLHHYSKFYKIITNNQKTIRKNNKGKFEFMESSDLLEQFVGFLKSNEGIEITYGGFNAENSTPQEGISGEITDQDYIDAIADGENTPDRIAQQNSIERNPRQGMRQQLISFFANIPKYLADGKTAATSPFGIQDLEDSTVVFATLISKIANSYSMEEFDKKLSNIDKPWKNDVIALFANNPRLRTLFWASFGSKNFAEFKSVYDVNGEMRVFSSNAKGIKSIIQEDLVANFLSPDNPIYKKGQSALNWTDNLNKTKTKAFLTSIVKGDEILRMLKFSGDDVKNAENRETLENSKFFEAFSETLNSINIKLSEDQIRKIYESGGDSYQYRWEKLIDLSNILLDIAKKLTGVKSAIIRKNKTSGISEVIFKPDINSPTTPLDIINPFVVLLPNVEFGDDISKGEIDRIRKRGKGSIQQLANIIQPALETELVSSFRGIGGKTKYNIILSGQINKMLEKFNNEDELEKHLLTLKDDSLVRNLPILQDLADGTLEGSFKASILDGLTRKGSNKAVPYSMMSDIELEITSMALFYNNGAAYRPKKDIAIKLGIPSDSPTVSYLSAKFLNKEEIVNKLVETGMAELKRINFVKKLEKTNPEAPLLRIDNYKEKAKSFQLLTVLNTIPVNKLNEETIRETIEKFLEFDLTKNTFLKKQVEQYTKSGIVEGVRDDGMLLFAEGVISSKITSVEEQNSFFMDYLLNTYYYQTQTNTLFAGDPSFYKNATNYQKRFKQIFSPGTYTTGTGTFSAIILKDSMVPTSKENLQHIFSIIEDSSMTSIEKEALKIIWKKAYEKGNNESDGGTYVSLDFRKKVLDDLGEWGDAHDRAYERIKNGNETIEDLEIIDPPAKPLKPFMFTKRIVDGVEVPIQIKNSETVLTKSFALKKDKQGNLVYPKLAAIYNDMQKGVYEVGFFESAVKVGGIRNIGGEFTEYEVDSEGNYAPSVGLEGMTVIEMDQSDYRKQQETPAHHIDEKGNFGSQLRTLIIGDINLTGDYNFRIDGEVVTKKGSEIVDMYQNIVFDDLQEAFESIEKDMVNEDGSLNYLKLIPLLRKHAVERNMGAQFMQAIAPVEVTVNDELLGDTKKITTALPLFHPRIIYQTETLLHSIFKNRVVKQKLKGGGLINTPSYGVSTLERENSIGLVDEKFHPKLKIEDGKITWQVLMPHTSKKFFPINNKGEVDFDYIKMYAPELLEIIANRIPTEDKYSMFNIEVIGFTPPSMANTIIMPPEVTTVAGLDFDIDKLFFMAKHYSKVNNVPKITKYYNEINSKEAALDLARNIFKNKILNKKWVDKTAKNKKEADLLLANIENTVSELALARKNKNASIKEIKTFIKKGEKELKDNEKKSNETVEALKTGLKETIDTYYSILDEDGVTYDDDLAEKSDALSAAEKAAEEIIEQIADSFTDKSLSPVSFNSRAARDNQKINIIQSILQSKNTAPAIINPGNFDVLKEAGARMRLLKANKIKEADSLKGKALIDAADALDENVDFNIAYPSTQLELFRRNMDGNDLIGIMANHNTHHAKAQYTSLKLAAPLEFNGNKYQALNKITAKNGSRISRSLATKLAAVVDNANEPISNFLNFNTFTANVAALGDRLGIEQDFVFALMNQPILLKLTRLIQNDQTATSKQQLILKYKKELLNELNDRIPEGSKIKPVNIKDLTTSLLEGTLSDKKGAKNATIQKSAFFLFEKLFEIGEELSRGVRAAKTDSISSYGSTGASDWAFLNKQRRVLKDKEQRTNKILGLEEVFLPVTSRQIMNPAFTVFGLYRPISIYEKIFPTIGEINESDPSDIAFSPLGLIKEKFTEFKSSGTLTEQEAQMINSNYLNFIASEFKFFNHSQAKEILGKLPSELLEFKNSLPEGSPFKPLMDQLHIVSPDVRSPITRIEFYQTGKFAEDVEALTDSWERMLLDGDPKIVEMAKKLIKYTYFANGFNFGPYTFANLVPIKFFTSEYQATQSDLMIQDGGGQLTLNELLTKRLLNPDFDSEYNSRFINQFIKNFSGKHAFIPTVQVAKELDKDSQPNYIKPDGKVTAEFNESSEKIVKDLDGNLVIIEDNTNKHMRNMEEKPIMYLKVFDSKKGNHYTHSIYKLASVTNFYNASNTEIPVYKYVKINNIGLNNVALEFDALNSITESIKPAPGSTVDTKTEAQRLAASAVSAKAAAAQQPSSGPKKTFTPKVEMPSLTQSTNRVVKAPLEGVSNAAIEEMSDENYKELIETGYTQWLDENGEVGEAAYLPAQQTSEVKPDTGIYKVQYKKSEFMVEVKGGVFQIFSTADNKQRFINRTPENDPVVKELYDLLLKQINAPLNTILGNLGTSINWGGLATDFETKFYKEKETSSTKILNKLLPEVDTKSTLHQIITKLKQVDFPVTFLPLAEFNTFKGFNQEGAYMFIYNQHIYLNDNKIKKYSGQMFVASFLHEMVHGYTLNKQNELTGKEGKELTELFDVAKNLSKTPEDFYGFTNEKEFVAEIYTNKAFAAHIKSLVINEDDVKTTSVWEQFVEWATSLFIGKKPTSTEGKKIYEKSMKLIESLIDQKIELQNSITASDEIFAAEIEAYKKDIKDLKEELKELNKEKVRQNAEKEKFFTDNKEFIIEEIDADGEGGMTVDIVDYLYGIKTVNDTDTKTIISEIEWNNLNLKEKYNILKCN